MSEKDKVKFATEVSEHIFRMFFSLKNSEKYKSEIAMYVYKKLEEIS